MSKIHARSEYEEKMKGMAILGREECPFCGALKDKNTCLWSSAHWEVFVNKYPYTGTEQHLMAVPKTHKATAIELTAEELADMVSVYTFMDDFYGDEHYFSCTRETMSGRSVEHYHIHFMPGRLRGKILRYMLMHQGFPIEEELDT